MRVSGKSGRCSLIAAGMGRSISMCYNKVKYPRGRFLPLGYVVFGYDTVLDGSRLAYPTKRFKTRLFLYLLNMKLIKRLYDLFVLRLSIDIFALI